MRKVFISMLMTAVLPLLGCLPGTGSPSTLTPSPTVSPAAYSAPELKYRLIARYGEPFFCDPDFYPIGRPGQEEKNAAEQFQAMRGDAAEFAAIVARLSLPSKADYTDAEKLAIYREHKKLTLAVALTASGGRYDYVLRLGEGQGSRIQGTITPSGVITETRREPSFNTCPICLARGTPIDTPDGPVPVEELRAGAMVWTVDEGGARVAASVVATSSTRVPPGFRVLKVTLADGRSLSASPGHPTPSGRQLAEYAAGDILDGSAIVSVEQVPYAGETFDILPSGPTGTYWAGGMLLKSTLARR